jgi:K+-sensing histidine kinase KdpD
VLGVVGHDVRGPLSLVLGHLEELTATWEQSTEETKTARVDKAFGAARRLAALIDDILAMANFDSGSIATRPIRVAVGEVVADALAGLHGAGGVDVRLDGSPVRVAAQQSGSGFGLYIVGRLAEANGCRLTYSPVSPTGSRFRLQLPSAPD